MKQLHNRLKVLHNEQGLSLVEVIASLFILSIALLLLSNFLVRSFEISGNQDNRQVAMNLARQTIEEWKSGNGWIDKDAEQAQLQINERFEEVPLTYLLLAELSDEIPENHLGIKTEPDVEINGKVYQIYAKPSKASPSSMPSNPLIRIEIKVFSNDVELAELETLVPNPDIG